MLNTQYTCVSMCVHSATSDSVNPRTEACQAPLSRGFSQKEYWRGVPFPPPVDLV